MLAASYWALLRSALKSVIERALAQSTRPCHRAPGFTLLHIRESAVKKQSRD
jgi:hypothetical protein